MTWMSKRRELFAVGLDINNSDIRALVLSNSGKNSTPNSFDSGQKYFVEAMVSVPLLPSTIIANEIKDQARLCQQLAQLRSQLDRKCSKIVMALPDHMVIHKTIRVASNLTATDIEAEIIFAANSAQDICFDYRVEPQSIRENQLITFVAAKSALVQSYQQALQTVGFEVRIIDVTSHAIAATWRYAIMSTNQTVVVLNITATQGFLTVIKNNCAVYMRKLNLNIDSTLIATELIAKQVQFAISQTEEVSCVYITGEIFAFAGLENALADYLLMPVETFNPLTCLDYSDVSTQTLQLLEQGPSWFLSYILALRGLVDDQF